MVNGTTITESSTQTGTSAAMDGDSMNNRTYTKPKTHNYSYNCPSSTWDLLIFMAEAKNISISKMITWAIEETYVEFLVGTHEESGPKGDTNG